MPDDFKNVRGKSKKGLKKERKKIVKFGLGHGNLHNQISPPGFVILSVSFFFLRERV